MSKANRYTPDFINSIIGTKINMLTVLEYLGIHKGKSKIKTQCECGTISIKILNVILRGAAKSCGCLSKEACIIHGLRKHPLYHVWHNMIKRCYNETDKAYGAYGAKGVKVCDEWKQDFVTFYNWAILNGWATDLQLDKDVKSEGKLYSPETCCFIPRSLNNRNTTNSHFITYGERTATIREWSIMLNMPYAALQNRITKSKWSIEKAFTIPVKRYQKRA